MSKQSPKVSIVVPIFNTERYLRRCVDSILDQSLTDLEVILVNDGSPDGSPAIMDEYARQDQRVRLVHQENRGLPAARNAGMALARGAFVGFVDSDDWVEPQMFESLYDAASRTDSDVAMCDYRVVGPDVSSPQSSDIRAGVYDVHDIRSEIFPTLVMDERLHSPAVLSVWRCLYDRSFLEGHYLAFDADAKYSEDYLFSLGVMLRARSFTYLKNAYHYNYWQNMEGISKTIKDDTWPRLLYLNQAIEVECANWDGGSHSSDFDRQVRLHMLYFVLNFGNRVSRSSEPYRRKVHLLATAMRSSRVRQAVTKLRPPKLGVTTDTKILAIKWRLPALYLLVDTLRSMVGTR